MAPRAPLYLRRTSIASHASVLYAPLDGREGDTERVIDRGPRRGSQDGRGWARLWRLWNSRWKGPALSLKPP